MPALSVPHLLKRNASSFRPRRIVCLAVRLSVSKRDPERHVYRLARGALLYADRGQHSTVYEPQVVAYDDAETCWQSLLSYCVVGQRLYVFSASMLASFTVLAGWQRLIDDGWQPGTVVQDDSICIMDWRRDGLSIRFLDVRNLLRDYQAPKSPPEGQVRHLYETLAEYLRFLDDRDCGAFAASASAQAFNAYRHRYMTYPIYIHTREDATALERSAYYGGRCECYRLGQMPPGEYTLLDTNSMYGSVMHDSEYPSRLLGVMRSVSVADLRRELDQYACVAAVEIAAPEALYPVRLADGTYWAVGRYTTTLADPELRLALSHGHIAAVETIAVYDRAALFRDFVSAYHNARLCYEQAGNLTYAHLCKLMINSVYGKFGQRHNRWELVGDADPGLTESRLVLRPGHRATEERTFAGRVEELHQDGNGANALVAIAACVASAARVRLLYYIEQAGWSHVLYVDTDSLIVDEAGLANIAHLVQPGVLGMLKIEARGAHCDIRNIKDYVIGTRIRRKGIPANAEWISEGDYRWQQGAGLSQMIHRGSLADCWSQQRDVHLTSEYRRGVVQADRTVLPFQLPFSPLAVPARLLGRLPQRLLGSE